VLVAAARGRPAGAPPPPRVAVGVITPYRQQARCLRDTFARAVGPEAAAEVTLRPSGSHRSCQPGLPEVASQAAPRARGCDGACCFSNQRPADTSCSPCQQPAGSRCRSPRADARPACAALMRCHFATFCR
jgi:hypothetical protein